MSVCSIDGCTEHYGCRLRAKGIALAASASPTARRPHRFRPPVAPSWEAGRAVQQRPDGSSMPILTAEGKPMPIKQFTEQRHQVERNLRDVHAAAQARKGASQ